MKGIKHIAVAMLLAGVAVMPVVSQNQTRSSSSVVRMRKAGDRNANKDKDSQVTQRMQSFYDEQEPSDADLEWMKVIYRQLDLKKEQNMALYYPEEPNQDGMNLFCIIMKLLANDQLSSYEYLDGREIFTDQYKIKVRDMLDRFHILYSDAKGSTEKHPKFKIEDSDVPSNEVLSYYIIEKWEFDRLKNKMQQHVEAICPVLHRTDEFGGEPIKYPMFWVKMDESLRPYIAKQYVFTDNDNNLPRYSYDDFFQMSMYKGDIYKTKNLRNLSMVQLYPDPDDLKRAQDSIENRLRSFDKHLWVPSREELHAKAAAAEAAAAAADTTLVIKERADSQSSVKKSARSSKRGSKSNSSSSSSSSSKQKKSKTPKVKEAKVSSSSSAARSVRRRR